MQLLLLQMMVGMWDTDSHRFMVGDKMLEIKVDDIYFLMVFSCRGESIYIGGRGGSGQSMDSYMNDLCMEGTHKQGEKLPIHHMIDVPLKTILFTIT